MLSAPATTDPGYRTVREFIKLDRLSTVVAAAAVFVAHLALFDEALVFVLYPFLGVHFALLTGALHLLDRRGITAALALVAATNWMMAVVVTVMFPWILAVMVLTVVMPLVLATPHLNGRALGWFLGAGALTLGLVGGLGIGNDDGGVLTDIDDGIELGVVVAGLVGHSIPVGLIVRDSNQHYRRAADEAVLLGDQIQESRRRLVHAADHERSRIERDLHDGAQQRLVAVGMQLRRLAGKTRDGDSGDAETLDTIVSEVEGAMNDLRDLAHGIYPPLLELRGLPEALTAVARRSPVPVTTAMDDVPRFDKSLEAAVYFAASEAMQNAAKHAPHARVRLGLDYDGGVLRLHIADDGPGFDVDSVMSARGLLNMADRIGSEGGVLEVTSAPGEGTVVTATVENAQPVESERRGVRSKSEES